MADKEKLVEIVKEAGIECENIGDDLWDMRKNAEEIADFMIANGVTVQEWISVKDSLPEDSVEVNLHTRSGVVGTGFYDKQTKSWVQCCSGGSLVVDVTHWMPLPEPPKGE